jgi:hypothetical protein
MHEFNQSLKYDRRMHAADIRGSIAYAKALQRVGILTPEEERKIVAGLQAVGKEWADGTVCTNPLRVRLLCSCAVPSAVPSAAGRRGHPHRERAPAE